MGPVQVCNLALAECGNRVLITSLSDVSPPAVAANLFYTPKTQMLLRAARWDFARAQVTLTVWKQAVVNGVTSANPPPQPFLFSYLWPADCIAARFVQPTIPTPQSGVPATTAPNLAPWAMRPPTNVPFVVATDLDVNGNAIKVILTNLPAAQLIYTRDLSQIPDLWDSLFLSANTAFLASYFINALARNAAQYSAQVSMTKSMLDMARIANGNEGIQSIDHVPDWLAARFTTGGWGYGGQGNYVGAGYYSPAVFACGLSY